MTNILTQSWDKSSSVKSATYHKEEKILTIEFTNGKRYEYTDVSIEIWSAMVTAESVGKYHREFIVGKFEYKQI